MEFEFLGELLKSFISDFNLEGGKKMGMGLYISCISVLIMSNYKWDC